MSEFYVPTGLALAYHEAGHIVAAFVNGVSFWSVTIVPDGDDLGCAEIENPYHRWERGEGRKRAALKKHLVGLFSGPAAESRFTGRGLEQTVGDHDEKSAEYWLRQYPPSGCRGMYVEVFQAYLGTMRWCAKKLVDAHWHSVERLAEALVHRRTMDQSEILDVLQGGRVADSGFPGPIGRVA